eukprot:gene20926-27774_t
MSLSVPRRQSARASALLAPAASGIWSRGIIDAGQALGPELDAEAIPPHETRASPMSKCRELAPASFRRRPRV